MGNFLWQSSKRELCSEIGRLRIKLMDAEREASDLRVRLAIAEGVDPREAHGREISRQLDKARSALSRS